MQGSLTIGDFSRATHLTVKTLRHYHETGLLEPAQVDPATGYRRYATEQIRAAQIIRRFRDLDMPLREIQAVLLAPDVQARNALITAHLRQLERDLARTQSAVASLRNLLEAPVIARDIGRRQAERAPVAAISAVIRLEDAATWLAGALGELYALLAAQRISSAGKAGGLFSNALFADASGEATIFVPCDSAPRTVGRVTAMVLPAVELATLVHEGPHANMDLTYGALATYVAQHALAVAGPLREYYAVGPHDTADSSAWRTEIGWPIFQTV
jgi:DNA-binding transcriptional MerR regulator